MPAINGLSTLLVGPLEDSQFRAAVEQLRAQTACFHCATAGGAREYLAHANGAQHVDLIVIAQRRPGEVVASQIDALARLAPLARIVLLLGSWCEGETRTGQPWPGATRLFWYDWTPQADRNLNSLIAGRSAPWSLPCTATEEERLLAVGHATDVRAAERLVVVCTRRTSWGEALSNALRLHGFATLYQRADRLERVQGAAAAVWDGVDLNLAEIEELRRLRSHVHAAPILALSDFPRVETIAAAQDVGAAVVMAKPLLLDDLYWQLERLTHASKVTKVA